MPQAHAIPPPSYQKSLEEFKKGIAEYREEFGFDALGIAIVDESGPVWVECMCDIDMGKGKEHSDDVSFPIGAVSSMFVGLAALKLVEEGRFNLNTELKKLAPDLEFHNPWEASHPVRFAHLLEQTAGWDGIHFAEFYASSLHSGANPYSLENALKGYSGSRRSRWVPGTRTSHDSSGPAAAAYAIEKVTGSKFEHYVQTNFFNPIGMSSSSYLRPTFSGQLPKGSELEKFYKDYPYLPYRPMNSVHASIHDMSKFLSFMIQRGSVDGNALLQESSITRMETPQTTLGADHGAVVAHGLATSITGHRNYQIPFFGHRARMSELSYSPQLKAGFVILATDKEKGVRTIAREIKNYLLQAYPRRNFPGTRLPKKFRQAEGYYKRISGFTERDRFIIDLVGILRVTATDTIFMRSPLLGSFESKDYYEQGEVLTNGWTGLPAIAIVDDPIEGEALQAWVTFKRVSGIAVYAKLIFIIFMTLVSAISLIFSLYWLAELFLGKLEFNASLEMRLWPSLSTYSGVFAMIIFYAIATPNSLGHVSPVAISLCVLSGAYACFAFIGCLRSLMLYRKPVSPFIYWHSTTLNFVHALFAFYLYSYGLIAVRTWTI